MNEVKLFEGVTLSFCRFDSAHDHMHTPHEHIIEINYCKGGRIGWDLGGGSRIFLGPGDFSIHTLKACADSHIALPQDHYEGLSLTLDLNILGEKTPQVFEGCGIDITALRERYCRSGRAACFSGSEETEALFSRFYSDTNPVFHRLKALELIAFLCLTDESSFVSPAEYRTEQIELVRKVHEYLLSNIEERHTIEELAKRFAVNPTTLKNMFRAVYGDSIAAHTKTHRMEAAVRMLTGTSMSLSEIASAVGYGSQSKFSAAFRETYGALPSDYRKNTITEVKHESE